MKVISRDIVSALIISKDNKLFQGKKDPQKGGVYVDCWHIPGGGIEAGEDKVEALIREVKEETGIDVSSYPINLVDDLGNGESEKISENGEKVLCKMKFYVYRIDMDDKTAREIKVSLDDDLVEYRWTDINDINKVKMTPPSVELFSRLKL